MFVGWTPRLCINSRYSDVIVTTTTMSGNMRDFSLDDTNTIGPFVLGHILFLVISYVYY